MLHEKTEEGGVEKDEISEPDTKDGCHEICAFGGVDKIIVQQRLIINLSFIEFKPTC
jgi:hypothetical protein